MIDNTYISKRSKVYKLGGLVNSEVDGLIITTGGAKTVCDITLSDGVKLSLTDRYGVGIEGQGFLRASSIQAGDKIDGAEVTVVSCGTRDGKEIVVPAKEFKLNGVLISTDVVGRKAVRPPPVESFPVEIKPPEPTHFTADFPWKRRARN